MQLGEMLGERQSQPDPVIFAGEAAVDLAETFQRLGDLMGRHADTGIGDLDGNIAAAAVSANANGPIRWSELDRIGEEVDQDLPHAPAVDAYGGQPGLDIFDERNVSS